MFSERSGLTLICAVTAIALVVLAAGGSLLGHDEAAYAVGGRMLVEGQGGYWPHRSVGMQAISPILRSTPRSASTASGAARSGAWPLRREPRSLLLAPPPMIPESDLAVIVPAYNEEARIVRAGMLAARAGRLLMSDADLATPIEELAKLEAALDGGADIAIGSRAHADSDIRARQHPARELMGRTFNVLVRLLVMDEIKDTQCGFKLFSAAAARDLYSRATIDGFAFDVELLWLARRRYRIAAVPVVWSHVEESKVSLGRDATRMLIDLVKLRARHLWRH